MATINTTTVTLNAAFLQEIKEVNEELWHLLGGLRSLASNEDALRSGAREWVGMFPQLRDQLAMYFALEEAYGYFENPVAAAPHLSERAAALKDEHRELYVSACQLAEHAESLVGAETLRPGSLSRLAESFAQLDERLARHESAENELIHSIYGDDLGVGD